MHPAQFPRATSAGPVRHRMRVPTVPKDPNCGELSCKALASHAQIRCETIPRTTINRLWWMRGATCKGALLFPVWAGPLSRQTRAALGGSSAVARLARTAALNLLVDHGVLANQPVPTHVAAVESTTNFMSDLIKPRKHLRARS